MKYRFMKALKQFLNKYNNRLSNLLIGDYCISKNKIKKLYYFYTKKDSYTFVR
jgi:hypothetical protein